MKSEQNSKGTQIKQTLEEQKYRSQRIAADKARAKDWSERRRSRNLPSVAHIVQSVTLITATAYTSITATAYKTKEAAASMISASQEKKTLLLKEVQEINRMIDVIRRNMSR